MEVNVKRMKLYKVSINLTASDSFPTNQTNLPNAPEFMKHWGVYIEVYVQNKLKKEKVIDAGDDGEGFLKCEMRDFDDVEDEWNGMEKKEIPTDKLHCYDAEKIKDFITRFNQQKRKYNLFLENCQEFVRHFLTELGVESMFATVQMVGTEAVQWGLKSSVAASGSCQSAMGFIAKQFLKSVGGEWTQIVVNNLEFFGTQAIDFLGEVAKTEAGKVFFEEAKEAGKQVYLTSYGEIIENTMNAVKGGFTWWQVLQIPVEIFTRLLLQTEWANKKGITKLGAYVGSKAASATTAGLVGLVGGPPGMAEALGMWIAAEVVTFFLRILFCWISTFCTKKGDDYFDKYFGPSQTLELINWILGTNWKIGNVIKTEEKENMNKQA